VKLAFERSKEEAGMEGSTRKRYHQETERLAFERS